MSTSDDFDLFQDSPFTDRISFTPPPTLGEHQMFVAFGASQGEEAEGVGTLRDWIELFGWICRGFISTETRFVASELFVAPSKGGWQGGWHSARTLGDYGVQLQRLPFGDAIGARLVNQRRDVVYQYELASSSSGTAVCFTVPISVATSMSVDVLVIDAVDDGSFLMAVDDDALAAMDEYDDDVRARYEAACEREAREQMFDGE